MINLTKKQKALLKEINGQTVFGKEEYAKIFVGANSIFKKITIESLAKKKVIEIAEKIPNLQNIKMSYTYLLKLTNK